MKIRRVINTVLLSLLVVLVGLGIRELMMFHNIDKNNESLKELVVKVPSEESEVDSEDPMERSIDFDSLRGINPDIAGWVYIPGTKVDYPILIGSSDEKYLSLDYMGNYSSSGSVFSYSGVDLINDSHVCLFAHNIISNQMFGSLLDYANQEFADNHQYMYIYTPKRTKQCSLVSVFTCYNNDGLFEVSKELDTEGMEKLYEGIYSRSCVSTKSKDKNTQIYTLGTCNGYLGTPVRFTVNFSVEKEKYILD